METQLRRIAALARQLSEAELRVVLELTTRATQNTISASSRELARQTKLSRSNVIAAIESLNGRGLITSDRGTATRASSHKLHFLTTAVLPGGEVLTERGPIAGPPPHQQVDLFQDRPGAEKTPEGGLAEGPPQDKERARAGVTSNCPSPAVQVLDDLLRANPKKVDDALMKRAHEWLFGYMRKFGQRDPHGPDQQIVA